jgi:TRAP-type C4-dicarboxylate transport system substrate-binding protein
LFKKRSKFFSLLLVVVMLGALLAGCGGNGNVADPNNNNNDNNNNNEDKSIYAAKLMPKFASEEIEGDFMTVWAEKYADHMREWSDGMYDVTVYPYGTLGDTRDINELAQIGVVEYVFTDFAWISAFVPEAQVLALNYIWPKDRLPEVLNWVIVNGDFMDVLEKSFRANGLVPLSVLYEGWQWVTSNKPVMTPEQFAGLKVRVMGSALLVETYKSYGGVPTPMSYGEVYSGLQMGLIDGQVNPLFAIRSMNFFEVQDHLTQLYSEPFLGIPTVNMQFFDSLPEEAQQEMRRWWIDAIVPSSAWIDEVAETDLAAMLAQRPEITVTELTDEQLLPFKAKAEGVYDHFLEIGGDNAEEILDTLLSDIEKAKAALGM